MCIFFFFITDLLDIYYIQYPTNVGGHFLFLIGVYGLALSRETRKKNM